MKCDVLPHTRLNQVINHIGSNPSAAPLGMDQYKRDVSLVIVYIGDHKRKTNNEFSKINGNSWLDEFEKFVPVFLFLSLLFVCLFVCLFAFLTHGRTFMFILSVIVLIITCNHPHLEIAFNLSQSIAKITKTPPPLFVYVINTLLYCASNSHMRDFNQI